MIERLDAAALLPAITFIFSRAGCDAAVVQCLNAGLRLATPQEAAEITALVQERTADIPERRPAGPRLPRLAAGLQRGIAAHHAGMLPTFKEVVEELFAAGLIRAVFATETLALGINMPARTVVIERLDKWNGETHADLTPGEYTQLTGRAGRRGIDVEGHAVVLWQPGMDPAAVAGLAGTRTYPLSSSFRPSYNMAVNLVGQVGRRRAAALLESSFAQFQADRAVVGIARQAQRIRRSMEDLEVRCHLGDFAGYLAIRRELSQREGEQARRRSAARQAEALRCTGAAAARRHHPRARRPPGGDRPGARVRPRRQGRADPACSCSPRTARSSGCRWPTSRCRSRPSTGCGYRRGSAPGQRSTAGTWPRPCATSWPAATSAGCRGRAGAARTGRAGRAKRAGATRRSNGCGGGCASIRATAARTATSMPGRPSGTCAWNARPRPWNAGSPGART